MRIHTGERAIVEVGFHSLRHTFVSLQAEQGTAQGIVQSIVGHGNPAMTQHYLHTTDAAARQAALAIEASVIDAEYEQLPEPLPDWVKALAIELNADNWKEVKEALLKGL